MSLKTSSSNENFSADVVIIGAGGAGLSAAVSAAENGAKVIVLEKRSGVGGNSVFAEGFFAADSPTQKRLLVDARPEELFRTAMSYAHWKLDARLVKTFIDKSGDTARWLEEKGLQLNWLANLYLNQTPQVWHCLKGGGNTVIKLLRNECERLGVTLLNKTSAKKIIIDKDSCVKGILAQREGKNIKISANSVIIATGGYSGNKKMLKKYCPYYSDEIKNEGLPHMGDGINMALEIGADTEGLGIMQLVGPSYPGPKNKARLHINALISEPNTIWVNKKGERFIDEAVGFNAFESVNALIRQPDRVCYTLFDEKIKKGVMEDGLIKGMGSIYVPPGTKLSQIDKEMESQPSDMIKKAKTWDEIARWMNISPVVLKATIEEYNNFCDQKYDALFAKDARYLVPLKTPLYYAIKSYPAFLGTIGGIKINHYMETLDRNGNPIPGLYTAGVDAGGWESETYCAILSGSTFGFALNSGRIAGENAAKYSLKIRNKRNK